MFYFTCADGFLLVTDCDVGRMPIAAAAAAVVGRRAATTRCPVSASRRR